MTVEPETPQLSAATPDGSRAGLRVGLFVTCLVDLIRPSVGVRRRQAARGCRLHGRGSARRAVAASRPSIPATAHNARHRRAGDRGVRGRSITWSRRRVPAPACSRCTIRSCSRRSQLAAACRRFRRQELRARVASWSTYAACAESRRATTRPPPITIPARGCANSACASSPAACSRSVEGLASTEMRDAEVCCGFGGTFCVKYPEISNAMVAKKAANIAATGAGLLLAGDLGCLMNMAGKLQREGRAIEVRHVAEVLAGMTQESRRSARRDRAQAGRRAANRCQAGRSRQSRTMTLACPHRDLAALQGQCQGGARRPRSPERADHASR